MRLDLALDRYIGDLARKGCSPSTRRSYWFKLTKLCDRRDIAEVTPDDCAAFIDQWADSSNGTLAHSVTTVKCFFRWVISAGRR